MRRIGCVTVVPGLTRINVGNASCCSAESVRRSSTKMDLGETDCGRERICEGESEQRSLAAIRDGPEVEEEDWVLVRVGVGADDDEASPISTSTMLVSKGAMGSEVGVSLSAVSAVASTLDEVGATDLDVVAVGGVLVEVGCVRFF